MEQSSEIRTPLAGTSVRAQQDLSGTTLLLPVTANLPRTTIRIQAHVSAILVTLHRQVSSTSSKTQPPKSASAQEMHLLTQTTKQVLSITLRNNFVSVRIQHPPTLRYKLTLFGTLLEATADVRLVQERTRQPRIL